jgi:tRNA(Ile)-lysidine synthase
MREENEYLDKIALEKLTSVTVSENESRIELDCIGLALLDKVILRRTIRLACIKFSSDLHDISNVHIEKIMALIDMQSGKKINIPNSITVQKTDSHICIGYEKETLPFCIVLEKDKETYVEEVKMKFLFSEKENLSFKNRYRIYCDEDAEITVRNRLAGDRIFLKGIGHKKLKTFFTDKKIPLYKKDSIPLIADGKNILCVCGYISACREKETQAEFYIHFE